MPKLYRTEDMRVSPFAREDCVEYLSNKGIVFVDSPECGDIIVAQKLKALRKYIYKYRSNKKYLIWTHEPIYNADTSKKVSRNFFPVKTDINIVNIYTGEIYRDNTFVLHRNFKAGHYDFLKNIQASDIENFDNKKIAVIASRKIGLRQAILEGIFSPMLKPRGKGVDLLALRGYIALEGYKQGKVDIYGKGWPKGISLEDSRKGLAKTGQNRRDRKLEILQGYNFNLCLENTSSDYYCSEKIWESIIGGCLPIYYGKQNRIYENFPQGSFLDCSEFDDPLAIFDYVERMSIDEFCSRMNLCIDAMNTLLSQYDPEVYDLSDGDEPRVGSWPRYILENTVQRIHEIGCN